MILEKSTRVGIVFHRFGPYHISRINSLARHFNTVGIEFSSTSKEYKWDKVEDSKSFKRVTVFNDVDSRDVSTEVLRKKIYECLDSNAIEVLFINGWGDRGGLLCLEWCIKNKVKAILMTEEVESTFKRTFVKEFPKKCLVGLFDAAIVGGKPQARYLNKLGMPFLNIKEGYDIVDNNYYKERSELARENEDLIRSNLKLPKNYFLTSNRFIPKKNLFRLLEAYKKYVDSRPHLPWNLILLGDGELKDSLIKKIESLDLQKYVLLPGFQQYNVLPQYYALAKAFVHSSTSEQWGLVVNEAMACSLPVIVSEQCGCAENLVRNNVNGYTFDPYNVEDIASKLIALHDISEVSLADFGKKSYKIIEEYNPDLFGDNAKLLIEQLPSGFRIYGIKRIFNAFVLKILLKLNKLK